MTSMLNSIPLSEQFPEEESGESSGKQAYLRLVPAVDQAVRLLFCLANTVGGESTLTELAKETGISKSKALAILNTLANAGLVTRNERTKSYTLGPNVVTLGRAFLNNTDLARLAGPYLEQLAAETGCGVLLGVFSGETLFVVARRQAPGGTYIATDVGQRYPLTWGAHGRAYLASLPPEEFEKRLAQNAILQAGTTDRDSIEREVLRHQVEEARRKGYGVSLGTTWSGLNGVSALIAVEGPDIPEGRRVAACLVAVGSFPPEEVDRVGQHVVRVAKEMEQKLQPLLRAVNPYFPLARGL
ncbi:MAG: IclR family transcriptional regulator [Thermoleophilia bacterium]|nr:IclR family transcriptional regulator [Thermoleophilia bacterium]